MKYGYHVLTMASETEVSIGASTNSPSGKEAVAPDISSMSHVPGAERFKATWLSRPEPREHPPEAALVAPPAVGRERRSRTERKGIGTEEQPKSQECGDRPGEHRGREPIKGRFLRWEFRAAAESASLIHLCSPGFNFVRETVDASVNLRWRAVSGFWTRRWRCTVSALHRHVRIRRRRGFLECRFGRDRLVTFNFHSGDPGNDAST